LKVCEGCGDAFTPKQPYAKRPMRFCSRRCYHLSQEPDLSIKLADGRRVAAVEVECQQCHKPFLAVRARVRAGRARFCSRSCARRSAGRAL